MWWLLMLLCMKVENFVERRLPLLGFQPERRFIVLGRMNVLNVRVYTVWIFLLLLSTHLETQMKVFSILNGKWSLRLRNLCLLSTYSFRFRALKLSITLLD
uniref:Uncharacterized protein n=1 Tax=Populus trichocarpa x Populus deltoides TaxID=3695 RepID=A9PIT4_9ROSI|nr:unknown [Populus trichocarpa x Populus deltoides]